MRASAPLRPRGASWRLFTWRALRAAQLHPPRAEADLSMPPRPAGGTRLYLSLYEVDVVLVGVKPQGQLGQVWVSKSVLGAAVSRSSAWLDAATEPKRKANFTWRPRGDSTERVVAASRGDCCVFTGAGDLIGCAVNIRRLTAFFQLSSVNRRRES